MSLIRQNVMGLSTCVVLSSCGSGLPTSTVTSNSTSGDANMSLQVDLYQDGNWTDVSSSTPYDLNCLNGVSDFKLRLLNSGTGSLNAAGTVVTISKTSDYAGGTMNGAAGDYVFSIPAQPAMPISGNSNSEFNVRLSNSNGDCMLGGRGYNHEGLETALITISTDDPANPTFSATLKVFGSS